MTVAVPERAVLESIARKPGGGHVLRWLVEARPAQLWPVELDWFVWLLLGGRGSGKTRAAVEALLMRVIQNRTRRSALVARTSADVRDVLVEGKSGVMACSPDNFRPLYEPSKRRLTWPNGALTTLYSADEPDLLRGPEHDLALCDELATWPYPETWDNLLMGLRSKEYEPRVVVATTPRPTPLLLKIVRDSRTVRSAMTTYENLDNLAPTFREQVLSRYEGTRLGRQELLGEIVEDIEGALWQRAMIDGHRVQQIPELTRVVVGVDPAATSGEDADETGIVVAAKGIDGRGYVLADRSCRLSPDGWGRRVVQACLDFNADCIAVESNQGGEMCEAVIRTAAQAMGVMSPRIKRIHAAQAKRLRAEPVAALYEQCVAADTVVEAEVGGVRIKDIRAGDRVWTRVGVRRVLWAGKTGRKRTLRIRTAMSELLCTGNHPLLTTRGFVHAKDLAPTDRLVAWPYVTTLSSNASTAASVSGTEMNVAVRAQRVSVGVPVSPSGSSSSAKESGTSSNPMGIGELPVTWATSSFTEPFGKLNTAPYRSGGTSTIGIMTAATTPWTTSLLFRLANMLATIGQKLQSRWEAKRLRREWLRASAPGGKRAAQWATDVTSVVEPLLAEVWSSASAAPYATATIGIASVEPGPIVDVYNLEVEGQPEYVANGLIVHNCRVSHVGEFPVLEDEQCGFTPDSGFSPDHLDALVHALTELMVQARRTLSFRAA